MPVYMEPLWTSYSVKNFEDVGRINFKIAIMTGVRKQSTCGDGKGTLKPPVQSQLRLIVNRVLQFVPSIMTDDQPK